jgi:hypothetical protein
MKPLIRKSWYTLTEAADYLTQSTEEGSCVSATDLLQLATEGSITLTAQVFSMAPAETGDLVLIKGFGVDPRTLPPEVAPPGARVEFYDAEIAEGSRLRVSPLNENWPPFLVWHPGAREIVESGQLKLPHMVTNLTLFKFWWRLALRNSDCNFSQLIPAARAEEPHLLARWIYFEEIHGDNTCFARIPLAGLPDDTLIGVTRDQLDALLTSTDTDTNRAGGQVTSIPDDVPEDIGLLIAAWKKFWKGRVSERDRSTLPGKDEAKDWLMSRGMSANLAKAGQTMIAPDWSRKGGRK